VPSQIKKCQIPFQIHDSMDRTAVRIRSLRSAVAWTSSSRADPIFLQIGTFLN